MVYIQWRSQDVVERGLTQVHSLLQMLVEVSFEVTTSVVETQSHTTAGYASAYIYTCSRLTVDRIDFPNMASVLSPSNPDVL